MRKILLPTAAAALILSAGAAEAVGGGNLAPEESPYAIWEPQTVVPLGAQPSENGSDDAETTPAARRAAHPPKKTP